MSRSVFKKRIPQRTNVIICLFVLASQGNDQNTTSSDEGGCGDSKCVAGCPGEDLDLGLDAWEKLGDQCFLWSKKSESKNWTEAEEFCKWQGGHLVSVTSKAINEYVVEGKRQRKISSVWVGGTDKKEEGVWTWTDCSSFKEHKFTAWAHHQPSNGKGQDCVDHWSKSWNDVKCSGEKPFVCTKKLCPYICPDLEGTKLAWDKVSKHVLMNNLMMM